MKHIIVGGVAGGATAAARIRRIDESSDIILIEKGKYISYANCGLPYYIGGVISDRSKLFVQTPESFGKRFNIDVRVKNEVISVDTEKKSIEVRRSDGSLYNEKYDKLLLSPGSVPVRPPLPGIDGEGIFTLRNVTDTDAIKAYMDSREIKSAVVVGGGFIGLEMAENLYHAGADVSIIEMGNQVMAPVDFSTASFIHSHLKSKGVHLHLQKGVRKFEKKGDKITVFFGDGEEIETDIVLLSIGVRPATALAKVSGIKIGEAGGIWVDEYLETSAKDIYAVGDAIEFPHPVTGKPWLNYLANPANRQGRIVADNMVLGNKESYEGAIGTSIAKVFDMTVASTGLPAKKLAQTDIKFKSSVTHSSDHAGYYPGAIPLTIKITFSPEDGKLYGAQCVGYSGVDKRIDQLSLVIKKGGTIYDLIKLEHAYAPPFSSAKDPVAIAGYVAGNIINGSLKGITWREMQTIDKNDVFIIDVRTSDEYNFKHIAGSVNIPLEELRAHISEIPDNKPIIIYCQIGLRGYLAQRILAGNGFKNVKNLLGGYKTYSTAMEPVDENCNINKKEQTSEITMMDMDTQRIEIKTKTIKVDACGLSCPGPILQVKQNMDKMETGERLEVTSTDAGFARDAASWCKSTGNIIISKSEDKGCYTVVFEKGNGNTPQSSSPVSTGPKGKTFIMFSDDLDKALATFVLANGAAATGSKVTIFFTFWGLNVIKKVKKPKVSKDIFGKMFGMMLPSNSLKLKLSKLNMGGIGSKMMRFIMKNKNIESVESLREQALKSGIEFIACQMSMDVMGVKKEELIDGITIGGVATYVERADNANMNLFI